MLSSRLLTTFREVARAESFGRAAARLSFTPSAVSQQIALLERQCGVRLFERGPRGALLTQPGEALIVRVDAILAELSDAENELRAIAGGRGGRVSLGSFPTATATFAGSALKMFRDRHPDVETRFLDAEPYETLARLQSRELDLAVVFDFDRWPIGTDYDGRAVSSEDGIEYVSLFDDPFVLVLPPDHQLADDEGPIAIDQLAGESILGYAPWGPDLEEQCRIAGFAARFDPSYRTADFTAAQALVAAGLGITLMAQLALLSLRNDVVTRRLVAGPVRHVKVALREHSYRTPATSAMVEIVRQVGVAAVNSPSSRG